MEGHLKMAKTMYLGNLPWTVTNDDLQQSVGQYAEVITARVATDRETGRSRGFGFVEVPDEQAQAVIDGLNGFEWEGRELTVNEAKPREERGGGNTRGGFGGGAGGGRPRRF
jgi:RNA recognition motif-containing protein